MLLKACNITQDMLCCSSINKKQPQQFENGSKINFKIIKKSDFECIISALLKKKKGWVCSMNNRIYNVFNLLLHHTLI